MVTGGTTGGTLNVNTGGSLGAAGNTLTMGVSGGSLTDTTPVTVNLNTSVTTGALTVDVNNATSPATVNVLTVASGQTATVNGASTVGLGSATTATNTVLDTYTGTDVPGSGGALQINGNFTVGVPNTNATSTKNTTVVDLSALSSFSLTSTSSGTLNIGDGVNTQGKLTLASGTGSVNTIDVNTINLGVSGSSNANAGCALTLGSGANTIEAGAINIGTGKSSAVMQFVSGAPAAANVLIEGLNGVGTANITISNETSGTATSNTSSLLLAGHNATVQAGTVLVGQASGSTAGTSTGTATFDTGVFDVATLNIGFVGGSSAQASTGGANGTFTLGGAAANTAATGVLNVGTSSSAGTFNLGSNTDTNASPGIATATFTVNGGTSNVFANIKNASTKGTTVATLNLNSGTLNMEGNAIGGATANSGNGPVAVNFPALANLATLVNLGGGGINAAGLTMSGAGTLVLSGADTYSGNTSISSGTISLMGNYTGGGTFTVASGATLNGVGSTSGSVNVSPGGILAPGDALGTLSVGSTTLAGTMDIGLNDASTPPVDLLSDAGVLDISSATSAVTFNVTGTPSQPAYVFADYGSLVGTAFATVNNLPAGYTINYDYQGNNQIALTTVPEPASLGLLGISATALLARRRQRKFSGLRPTD